MSSLFNERDLGTRISFVSVGTLETIPGPVLMTSPNQSVLLEIMQFFNLARFPTK